MLQRTFDVLQLLSYCLLLLARQPSAGGYDTAVVPIKVKEVPDFKEHPESLVDGDKVCSEQRRGAA